MSLTCKLHSRVGFCLFLLFTKPLSMVVPPMACAAILVGASSNKVSFHSSHWDAEAAKSRKLEMRAKTLLVLPVPLHLG